jgi:signal transduction histidine kinase/ABC-type uncharacterized transport system substrate-binding protein
MNLLVYSADDTRGGFRKRWEPQHSGLKIRFPGLPVMLGMVLMASSFCLGQRAQAASGEETKRVLILYSFDKDEDFFYQFDRTLRSRLESDSSGRVEFYTEYLDLVRFPGVRHEEILDRLLKLKLSEQKPDLIIPVSYPALNFLLEKGRDLFPETPIVFSCVGDSFGENLKSAIARTGRHNVSGILLGNQQGDTLKLAFELQPDTQRVVAVTGTTPLEQFWLNQLERELTLSRPGIAFTRLSNLPMSEILKKVAVLPPHTVIFYPYFFLDSTGRFFSPEEALDLISGAADVPVYGSFRSYIGHGLVGGQMLDYEDVARKTAEDASRALRGIPTPDPRFTVDSTRSITVDWRQLQRWNIDESRLPPGTVVLFKETSLFDRYRWYILGVVTLCLCEAVLIFALLIQGARRKRAEEALATLPGRLLEAQEQERIRIARELHDDVNQQLAVLAIGLEQLTKDLPGSMTQLRARTNELQQRAVAISSDVQALSHQLHSSKLEYLSLVTAMEGFCREFSAQHQVEIRFSHTEVPNPLPREISLCLFRIMQEALSNAVKYSGVKCFDMELLGKPEGVQLKVSDRGRGFDVDKVLSGRGIGLISMRERVRLVSGSISITSKPDRGTTVEVEIPLLGRAKAAKRASGE